MFQFPEQTTVNKVLPKTKIYDKTRPAKTVRDLFVSDVEQIVWKYKLSPDTLRLSPADGIQEIQVFEIALKRSEISLRVLETIDRAIPYPVIYRLCRGQRVRHVAAFKRPAQDGSQKWMIGEYYQTPWTKDAASHNPLPLSLNLKSLYDQMMRAFIALPAREGEQLSELVEREYRVRQFQRQLSQLETKLRSEKQFNRKVDINTEIRSLIKELENLGVLHGN
jgi:hypothetical protein